MKTTQYIFNRSATVCMIVLIAFGLLSSCSGLLDADNPNRLVEEDLLLPTSAQPMVNGSLASVTRAVTNIIAPYATAADELTWVGSRDAWSQLQMGFIGFDGNEFTDAALFYVGEARWWSDDVVARMEQFVQDGEVNESLLADAYLYSAIIHTTIGDMFDDFANSDRITSVAPVGPANMNSYYQTAITYMENALALGAGNELALRAMLARAHHGLGVWGKVNPVNTADPLVNSAAAITAAQDALAAMTAAGEPDFRYQMILDGTLGGTLGDGSQMGLTISQQVNDRLEMRISDTYIIVDDSGKKVFGTDEDETLSPATSIALMDPVTGAPDLALFESVQEFVLGQRQADITVLSAREMHLILAEAALAGGNTGATFRDHINDLRALGGQVPFNGEVSDREILEHSRQVYLFLQGRRLADHYRFDDPAPDWMPNSEAIGVPGTFFPLTTSELQSNETLSGG